VGLRARLDKVKWGKISHPLSEIELGHPARSLVTMVTELQQLKFPLLHAVFFFPDDNPPPLAQRKIINLYASPSATIQFRILIYVRSSLEPSTLKRV
jgi:hypothetical protein